MRVDNMTRDTYLSRYILTLYDYLNNRDCDDADFLEGRLYEIYYALGKLFAYREDYLMSIEDCIAEKIGVHDYYIDVDEIKAEAERRVKDNG